MQKNKMIFTRVVCSFLFAIIFTAGVARAAGLEYTREFAPNKLSKGMDGALKGAAEFFLANDSELQKAFEFLVGPGCTINNTFSYVLDIQKLEGVYDASTKMKHKYLVVLTRTLIRDQTIDSRSLAMTYTVEYTNVQNVANTLTVHSPLILPGIMPSDSSKTTCN